MGHFTTGAPSTATFEPLHLAPHNMNAASEAVNNLSSDVFGKFCGYSGLWLRGDYLNTPTGVKGYSAIIGHHQRRVEGGWLGTNQFQHIPSGDGDAEYIGLNSSIMPWTGATPYPGGWVTAVQQRTLTIFPLPDSFGGAGPLTRVVGAPAGLPEDIPGGFSIG